MSRKSLDPLVIPSSQGGGEVVVLEYPAGKRVSKKVIDDVDGFQEASFKSQEEAKAVFQKIADRIERSDNLVLLRAKMGDVGRMRGKDAEWETEEIRAGVKDGITLERALQGKGQIEIVIGQYLPRTREWKQISMNYSLNIAGVSSGIDLLKLKKKEKELNKMLSKAKELIRSGDVGDGLKVIYKVIHLITDDVIQGDLERLLRTEDARKSRILKWIEAVEDHPEEAKEDEYREASMRVKEAVLGALGGAEVGKKVLSGGYVGGMLDGSFEAWMGGSIETRESIIADFLKRTGRRSIQPRYIPKSLSLPDLKKQLRSIEEGTDRPIVKSFQSKKSSWSEKAKVYFGVGNTGKEDMAKILSKGNTKRERELMKGFDEIYDRGMKAYETSGSRPNQTPFSWGMARVQAVLFGSPSRNQDADVVEKYGLPLLRG